MSVAVVMKTDHAEPRKEAELAAIAIGTVLMTPGMPLAVIIGKIVGSVSPTTTFQLPGTMFSGGRATEDGVTGGALTVSVAAADAGAGGVVGLAAAVVLPHFGQNRAFSWREAPHWVQKAGLGMVLETALIVGRYLRRRMTTMCCMSSEWFCPHSGDFPE